ncbi:hypothetical protein HYU13_06505 [Candidatus Woesearchaeota archaeon]|nr:hypothetical protein [Candidatus Woesearchaeota archaeon]
MQGPTLELYDLDELLAQLNHSLADYEDSIVRGQFEPQAQKTRFVDMLASRKVESMGRYVLIQSGNHLGFDYERRIGEISIEAGYSLENSDGGARYEEILLRLKQPLELIGGLIIPDCKIKLFRQKEDLGPVLEWRKDRVRRFGLFWSAADLSKVLPSEWFYGRRAQEDYLLPEQERVAAG